jgi:hypothetical protein
MNLVSDSDPRRFLKGRDSHPSRDREGAVFLVGK